MKIFLIVFALLVLSAGCANWRKPVFDHSDVGAVTNQDYVDHLAALGDSYLTFSAEKKAALSDSSKKYLNNIYDRIIKNNEIFLPKREAPVFYIIEQNTPFLFSLPRAQFFISSGLLKKFLKNEQMFVAALSREIVRSQRDLYEKNLVVMTGNVSTEKMFQIQRLELPVKNKLNEWSFVVLRRSGFDASALLAWVQLQNKNPLDFALYSGDRASVSREEYAFKNYLVKTKKVNMEVAFNDERNSSKPFYKLLSEIKE